MTTVRWGFYAFVLAVASISSANAQAQAAMPPQSEDRELPGGLEEVLGRLNLSAGQKNRIASLYAQAQPRFKSLEAVTESTQKLLALTPPNDPGYAAVLAAAKANAANAIQIRSDLWTQIFVELTPWQQTQLPGVFTAHKVASSMRKSGRRSIDSAS